VLSFNGHDIVFKQKQGITIFYQLGRVSLVKTFHSGTRKTVRVRKGTMAGGGCSAGFEQEKGRSASVLIP
jgi:hypothetical protein